MFLWIGIHSAANLAIGLKTAIRRGRPLCLPFLRNVHLQREQAWKPAPTGLLPRFGWLWCLSDDVVVITIGLFALLDTLGAIGLAFIQLGHLPKDIISHS